MFKVLHILSALAAIWISVVICEDCLYQLELWAAEDPTTFFYCDPTTNTEAVGNCMPNTGFVKNETVSGCVPWTEWNDTCVNKIDVSTINCEGDNYLQPHGIVNPQLFYLCPEQNDTAVELECEDGRAFYKNDLYLGCLPWGLWRNLTGCLT